MRTHQGSPWKHLMPAGICGLFVAGGIYALATFHPPSPGKAALVVIGFALLMLFFIFLALREAAARLELFERGLVYTRGGAPRSVRYADIARAIERSFNHKPAQLILELRGGGTLEIQAHLEDYDAAAQAIAGAI